VSIDFRETDGALTGSDTFGREWRIRRTFTGWRLEFTDPGDNAPTNAGVHATVAAAQAEANTPSTMSRPRLRFNAVPDGSHIPVDGE